MKQKNTSILTKYLQDYTVHKYEKKFIKSVSKDTKKDETSIGYNTMNIYIPTIDSIVQLHLQLEYSGVF